MVDSEYSANIYMSLNINIETVMSNHLKTKKICNHAVKKLPFLIRYVPDQYKIQ